MNKYEDMGDGYKVKVENINNEGRMKCILRKGNYYVGTVTIEYVTGKFYPTILSNDRAGIYGIENFRLKIRNMQKLEQAHNKLLDIFKKRVCDPEVSDV